MLMHLLLHFLQHKSVDIHTNVRWSFWFYNFRKNDFYWVMKNKFWCLIHVVFPVLSQMSCFSSGQIFLGAHYKLIILDKKCGLIFLKHQKCLSPTSKLKALRQPHMRFQMHENWNSIFDKNWPLKTHHGQKLDLQGEMNMLWNFVF